MSIPTQAPIAQIVEQHHGLERSLPLSDIQDFADATRGLIATLDPCVIRAEDGRVVWDNDSYGFLHGEAPDTANPSLWRQSSLVALQGLFEVAEGIYQVRGFDLSNITFVEGKTGVVAIDPLISTETAAAALALYREHRGDRPVTGVIYTHSHVDHFGGVKGVVSQEDVDAGRVPVVAPAGFVGHAVVENVYAGTAMARRAGYMYGAALPRGPKGQIGAGLGQTTSTGSVTMIAPTLDISTTGQQEVVDGVRMVFQMAPDSEAPAEMHFYLPDFKALCMAENATHTLHNLLTLRGALVRDPHAWAGYLTEAIDLFGDGAEVVFASHHWPTWGRDRIVAFLATQRDLYAYLHDQTLRMLNRGLVGSEIAEQIQLPPALEAAWNARGYYGSVSHNVKAIYQRYMGWYDGNPAHLWQHPPSRRLPVTSSSWAGRTPSWRRPAGPMTQATCAGLPRSSATSCSPNRPTPKPARCSPTPSSSSATGPRTAPGEAPTCPAQPSFATVASAPRSRPRRRTWSQRSVPSCSSTLSRSGSTALAHGESG